MPCVKCTKCSYVMSGAIFLGYLAGDLYEAWKNKMMRGISDDLLEGATNKLQVPCPICKNFEGWKFIQIVKEEPLSNKGEKSHVA